MTDYSITIQEASTSQLIPQYVEILNYNSEAFKDAIELIVNTFRMNTATVQIGESDMPVDKVTLVNLSLINGGYSLVDTGDNVVSSLLINGDGDSVLTVDKLVANTLITTTGLTLDVLTVNDSITVSADAAMSVLGSFSPARSVVESYTLFESAAEDLVYDAGEGSGVAKARITLTSSSQQNNYFTLNAQDNDMIYDGSIWLLADPQEIWVYIDLDKDNPPVSGQTFNFCLNKIVNAAGDVDLTSNLSTLSSTGFKLLPGAYLAASPDVSLTFGCGVDYIILNSSGDRYQTNVRLQYIYDPVEDSHILQVLNVFEPANLPV